MPICKDCVRYEMCRSLMVDWHTTACALGVRRPCEHYEKAEQALKERDSV